MGLNIQVMKSKSDWVPATTGLSETLSLLAKENMTSKNVILETLKTGLAVYVGHIAYRLNPKCLRVDEES